MTKILNQNVQVNYLIDDKIFERSDELLSHELNKHSQVLIARFDVHPVKRDIDISRFNQRLVEKEKRKGYDPLYITVPEVGESGNTHYHEIFFLNGNKIRHGWALFEDANRVLNNMLGEPPDKKTGLIHISHCKSKYEAMIRRNSIDKNIIREMSKKISYPSKVEQKDKVKGKSFFSSQIKK